MDIKQQLNLILDNLASKSEEELQTISKKYLEPSWEYCKRSETAFVTIDNKARKYKLLSYDFYPCYRLLRIKEGNPMQLTFKLNGEGHRIWNEAIGEFYDNYCKVFAYPSKHYTNINHSMRVFKIHSIFITTQLTPIITAFCKENRVPF